MTEDPVKLYVIVMAILHCVLSYVAYASWKQAAAYEAAITRAPREAEQMKQLASEVKALVDQIAKSELRDGGETVLIERVDADLGGVETGEDVLKIAEEFFVNQSRAMNVLEKVAKATDISRASEIAGRDVENQEIRDYTPKDFYGPHLREGLAQRETLVRADGILKEAFSKVLRGVRHDGLEGRAFPTLPLRQVCRVDHKYRDGIMDPFYAAWGGVPVVEKRADAAELLNYKLGTIARTDILKQILGEGAHPEFVRHPIGAYERWTREKPDWKAVVDSLLKSVPSEKAPDA